MEAANGTPEQVEQKTSDWAFDGHEERPVMREFGPSSSKGVSPQMSKLTKQLLVLGIVTVIIVGGWFSISAIRRKKAPEFNVAQMKFPEAQTSKPVASIQVVAPSAEAPASAPVAASATVAVDLREDGTTDPKTLEEARAQLAALKDELATLERSLADAKQQVLDLEDAAKRPTATLVSKVKKRAKPAPKPVAEDEFVSLAILDIGADGVVVSEPSRPGSKIIVRPGALLPGGATFIGFDPEARLMKTDQGDFFIQQ